MNIIVNRTKTHETQNGIRVPASNSSFNKRWGSWGIVTDLHSEDCTVDVVLDSGVVLKHVPVASKEWVISDKNNDAKKGFNTGERDLPPVKAWVFVFMPTFTFSDCFIAPFSMLNIINKNASDPFLQTDKENIKERITPGGWHITDDYITGSHKAVSPDEKTSLEIDYGNKEEAKENPELHLNIFENVKADIIAEDSCKLKIFDTEIEIKQGEASIKPKETTIEADGDIITEAKNINLNGDSKRLVTYAELNAALQQMWTAVKTHTHDVGGVTPGSGASVAIPSTGLAGVTLDISAAETQTIKTGG